MDKNLVVSLDEIKGIHIQCKECECEVVVSPAKPYFYGLTCPQGHPWQERPFSSFIDTFLGALRQLIESPALFKAVRLEIDAKLAEGRNEYGMDKRSAMEMVNEHLGNRLLYGRNTSFAKYQCRGTVVVDEHRPLKIQERPASPLGEGRRWWLDLVAHQGQYLSRREQGVQCAAG